jgi:ABC-type Fe3+ transport system substrate-binding protein
LNILAAEEMWGREKALGYVKQLSKQISGLIRCNETERVVSGEFLALIMDCSGADTFELKDKGAPVDLMIPLDGAMIRYRYLAIPKNAEHPNAAKLFTIFMMTEEGQKLLWEFSRQDLHLFPESNIGRKVRLLEKQGIKFFVPSMEWAVKHADIEKIREEMEKILRSGEK